jgi:hypothetical protein
LGQPIVSSYRLWRSARGPRAAERRRTVRSPLGGFRGQSAGLHQPRMVLFQIIVDALSSDQKPRMLAARDQSLLHQVPIGKLEMFACPTHELLEVTVA